MRTAAGIPGKRHRRRLLADWWYAEGSANRAPSANEGVDVRTRPAMPREEEITVHLENTNPWRVVGGRWRSDPGRPWTIRFAWQKLQQKYLEGTTRVFDIYVFANPRQGAAAGNRLLDPDIMAADRLMSANIVLNGARDKIWKTAEDVERPLREIPWKTTLEQASDGQIEAVVNAVRELRAVGCVQLPIATKLLFIKLPYLVPMVDSVVQDCFHAIREDVASLLRCFRNILCDSRNEAPIAALRGHLHDEVGIDISPVRILEQLIWFDWYLKGSPERNGVYRHRVFRDWGWRPSRPEKGVCRI